MNSKNYRLAEQQHMQNLQQQKKDEALKEVIEKVEELILVIDKFPSYNFPIMVERRIINSVKWLVKFKVMLKSTLGK